MEQNRNECSLGGICGGCFYCGKAYEEQLQEKDSHVRELLEGNEGYIYDGILESPLVFGYRNKMEYSFGDSVKGGPLTLGLHKKKSFYDVIDVDCCKLVNDDFNKVVATVLEYLRGLGLTYADKRSHLGYLRHMLLRRAVNTGEMLIDLVTTTQPLISVETHKLINDMDLYDQEAFAKGQIVAAEGVKHYDEEEVLAELVRRITALETEGKLEGHITGILHTVNDSLADAIKDGGTTVLYGQGFITEDLLGLKFDITPFSFFQTNSKGAEVLYTRIRDYIKDELRPDMRLFDLYSGTGTIAQLLAESVKEVIGVEIIPEAVEAAKINAERNGLHNCSFIANDVLKALDTMERPDVIVLDPPRDGVNPKALRKILDYNVEHMVYISCKPESLARDLVAFRNSGYRLVKATAVDQFPWTKNTEVVALISKVK